MNLFCIINFLLEFTAWNAETTTKPFDAVMIYGLLEDQQCYVKHIESNEKYQMSTLKLI